MKMWLIAAAAAFFMLSSTQTYAQLGEAHFKAWDRQGVSTRTSTRRVAQKRQRQSIPRRYSPAIASVGSIIPNPAGCPPRLFCGCGAAVEVFGRPLRHLWTAAAWLKFPPATPGPGMVAANRRHVMVIRQMVGPNTALVYDANSGGNKTRVHVRSLAGYSIRNPRA